MNKPLLTVAISALLWAGSAWAEDQAIIEQRNAQARFDEGIALANKGQYEEARVKFVQAFAVLKAPDVLYNLAVAEKKSAHPVESIRHFRTVTTDPKSPTDLVARARRFMDELSRVTAHVTVHAPDGSDILVDGEAVARAPTSQPVDVLAGKRTFSIALKGIEAKQDISLTDGESTELTLSLPTLSHAVGDVKPPPGGALPPSTRSEAYRPSAGWIAPATVGVLGLAGVAVGIGFGATSQGSKSDRDALLQRGVCFLPTSPGCTQYTALVDAQNSDTAASIAGYVAGGVLLAASVTMFLLWPKATREVAITPAIGPGSFGVVGRF